jgi:outer membrane protein assembly factor BamB
MRSSLPTGVIALALSLLPPTLAIFADEAYKTDYHHALLGLPSPHTTFFHRPSPADKAALLYTLSDLGVLGAVNPGTGALVWRQHLAADANRTIGGAEGVEGHLRALQGENRVVSALGGYVNAWDATTGRESWYNAFEGTARDVEVLGTQGGEKDVLALFEGAMGGVVRRLDGATGDVKWEAEGHKGDLPLQVSTDGVSVFVVSLHGARGGYNVRVTSLDAATGKKADEHLLAAKADLHDREDVLFVGANVAAPIIAWADRSLKNLKVNILGTKAVHSLPLNQAPEAIVKLQVHAPHLIQSKPHFLVHSQSPTNHWAEVYHVDIAAGTVKEAYHLPKLSGKGAFATSSLEANVFFTRITDEEVIIVSSNSHGVLGRFPLTVEPGTDRAVHAVSEVVKKSADTYAVRSAVVTSKDNWTMIRNGQPAWNRVEGLSGAVAAAFAEIPEEESLAEALEVEAHSNPLEAYIHRLNRHINELQYLPEYLQKLPMRLMSSLLPGADTPVDTGSLSRDNFGFRKLVILATERGRIYCLDAANQGNIVWSHRAFDIPAGSKWDVKGIFVDNIKGTATIRGSKGEYIIVKTITGVTVEILPIDASHDVQATALVDSPSGKWLLPIQRGGDPGIVPKDWAPKDLLVVRGPQGEVNGLKFTIHGDNAIASAVWSFKPAAGERIVSVTSRPAHDPVASIGRALADRTVLYKYLNPNIILVSAVDDAENTASFYLLDSVSGAILYSTTHTAVDATQPIAAALSENWFVYSFFASPSASAAAQGHRLVVTELFESALANDRGPLGSSANFSSLDPSDSPEGLALPHVITQAFIVPEPISHLAVTQTRQGISTRQILASLPRSNSIIGLSRNLVDARRPARKDNKATAADAEEGLVPYAPVLEFDPRAVVSHEREVRGVRGVAAAPALLESTSLVVVWGLDVWGSRVTPSAAFDVLGAGFNKVALVATVVGLAVGVGAVAPFVRRKQIDLRWKSG